MRPKMEAGSVIRERISGKRPVAVKLSRLAFEALAGENRGDSVAAPAKLESAVRCYLGDRGASRPAWPYPAFLRGSEVREEVELELRIDNGLWRLFEEEAGRQEVSVQQLTEHAAFYFAAEVNAGRITQRILDDLEAMEAEVKKEVKKS